MPCQEPGACKVHATMVPEGAKNKNSINQMVMQPTIVVCILHFPSPDTWISIFNPSIMHQIPFKSGKFCKFLYNAQFQQEKEVQPLHIALQPDPWATASWKMSKINKEQSESHQIPSVVLVMSPLSWYNQGLIHGNLLHLKIIGFHHEPLYLQFINLPVSWIVRITIIESLQFVLSKIGKGRVIKPHEGYKGLFLPNL